MKHAVVQYWEELREDYARYKQSKSPVKVKNFGETPTFLDFLSYRAFDAKYGIFENHKTIGFGLRISHFSGVNESFKQVLNNLITNDLSPEYTVQLINYASPRIGNLLDYWYENGSRKAIFKCIADNRRDFFQRGVWNSILGKRKNHVVRNFELYLFVSTTKPLTPSGKTEAIYNLTDYRQKLVEGLKGLNSDCFILNYEDLSQFLKEIINPSFNLYKEKDIQNYHDIRQVFANDQKIYMANNGVMFGSFKYITFEVTELPPIWRLENSIDYIGMFDEGSSIPCPFYISYSFKLDSREKSASGAGKHRIIKAKQNESKLPMFFPKMWEEMEDWNLVNQELNGGARLGKMVMYITLCIPSQADEKKYQQMCIDHFARLKFKVERVNYDTLNTFIATLPFGVGESWQMLEQLKVPFKVTSNTCINLLPAFADSQNYGSPLMMFTGRRGQLTFFDNFDIPDNANSSFNIVIVGVPGSGKSVWLEEYSKSVLRVGGQVVILDDGRSFQNPCEILGGDFADFGGGDFCINPFSLYQGYNLDELMDDYKKDFEEPFIDLVVSQLCIIANIDKNNRIDPEVGLYRTVMKNAVTEVIRKKGNAGGFSDVREELINNQNIRSTQTIHIVEKLEYILRSYSENGRYAGYFNGKATVNINSLLSVFELSDLEHNQDIQTSVLLTVIFLVYSKMRARECRMSLIIDEAWKLLPHPAIRDFIDGIARRARKYKGSLEVATQRISDFDKEKSEAAAAVLGVAEWVILFSVEGKDDATLKNQLGMSDAEIEIARKLCGLKGSYSEFMLRHKKSGRWQICRLMLDKFSAKLYSTNADDVVAIKKLKAQGLTVVDAINYLIASEVA